MAHRYSHSVDANALAAATAETIIEIAVPATRRIKIVGWWAEFDGVSATGVPVKVEVGRFTVGITTGTTRTPVKLDPADPASLMTTVKDTVTAEGAGTPEAGIETHRIHPQGGLQIWYPPGEEPVQAVSTFWRLRCTAAAIVNVTAGVIWEE